MKHKHIICFVHNFLHLLKELIPSSRAGMMYVEILLSDRTQIISNLSAQVSALLSFLSFYCFGSHSFCSLVIPALVLEACSHCVVSFLVLHLAQKVRECHLWGPNLLSELTFLSTADAPPNQYVLETPHRCVPANYVML